MLFASLGAARSVHAAEPATGTGAGAAGEPLGVDVVVASTRPGTVVERRANRVRGWSYTLPPVYTSTEQWETVCVAPCRIKVDPNNVFHAAGDIAPSETFVLPPGPGPFRVRVDAGSKGWYTAGIWMVALGIGTAVFGTILALNASSDDRQLRTAGLITTAAGAALSVSGLIAFLTSGSSVEVSR
jgi:hypothetical protein